MKEEPPSLAAGDVGDSSCKVAWNWDLVGILAKLDYWQRFASSL